MKNPELFLEVANLAKVANKNFYFVWVGDGELKEEMLNKTKELGLDDVVEFYGYTSNPYPLLKEADIFLHTSASESFSLVTCEALSLSKPVVAVNSCGPREILGENKYGILTSSDAKEIFNSLCSLESNKDLKEGFMRKASSRIEDFSVDKGLNSIYSLAN